MTETKPEGIRINKYLSVAGVCSRREADRLIEAGRLTVNGSTAMSGMRISPEDQVLLDGTPVTAKEEKVLLLFHKPRGLVCSAKRQFREKTVVDYLNYPTRIYPVGRLDKESEGLLLLTNQGDLMNEILKARNFHEKEYLVRVDRPITPQFIQAMAQGVPILDTVTRPCVVTQTGKASFRIILTQGLNRQIRRMCEALGYEVKTLKRIRIMNLTLDGLAPGESRKIRSEEYQRLLKGLGKH